MIHVREDVKLNKELSEVIWKLAEFTGGVALEITSGVREPLDQLHLIGWYATRKNCKGAEFDVQDVYGQIPMQFGGEIIQVYKWQPTWSRLLHLGIVINPPLAAVCLEDSKRIDGSNRKGQMIPGSPHSLGTAFDISGAPGLDVIETILQKAKAAGVAIRSWLKEHENNCMHVNVQNIVPMSKRAS